MIIPIRADHCIRALEKINHLSRAQYALGSGQSHNDAHVIELLLILKSRSKTERKLSLIISSSISKCLTFDLEISAFIDASKYSSFPRSKVLAVYTFQQNKLVHTVLRFCMHQKWPLGPIHALRQPNRHFLRLLAAHATSCWAVRNCKSSSDSADQAHQTVTTAPTRIESFTSFPSSQPSTSFKSGRTSSTIGLSSRS